MGDEWQGTETDGVGAVQEVGPDRVPPGPLRGPGSPYPAPPDGTDDGTATGDGAGAVEEERRGRWGPPGRYAITPAGRRRIGREREAGSRERGAGKDVETRRRGAKREGEQKQENRKGQP